MGDAVGVWAVNDGEKVRKDEFHSKWRSRNAAWDGRKVTLSCARNEIVAFQVIVEAGKGGVESLSAELLALDRRGGGGSIRYSRPTLDPSEYVGKPIGIFTVNYMLVREASKAWWVYAPGSPAAPESPLGWQPVQLVPENARAGKGGFPISVAAGENQAIWFEIYVARDKAAGIYDGAISVRADGSGYSVPVELEIFDFALPDRNSMSAMVYYEPAQPELYQGRNLDDVYHRFAHRQRIELVTAYSMESAGRAAGRFSGADFTPSRGYEGPGEGVGNVLMPTSFYGPGADYDQRAGAWAKSDAWMAFLEREYPGVTTFLYMPDEPSPTEYERIKRIAENVHSNPGPGKKLPIFVTKQYVSELDAAIDIWCAWPGTFDVTRAAQERKRGRQYWTYNGARPYSGAILVETPATDARATIWACFKHEVQVYFFWHGVHWQHNWQKQGERNQNVWADPVTFNNIGQPNKTDQGTLLGDGVLMYPGEERLHPEEDRGIAGPCSTVQLANLRRGLQDHQYLSMASELGLDSVVSEAVEAIVPRVFSESGERVSFAQTGDEYETQRRKLGKAIEEALKAKVSGERSQKK